MYYFSTRVLFQEVNGSSSELQNLNSVYSEVSDDSERETDQGATNQRL